ASATPVVEPIPAISEVYDPADSGSSTAASAEPVGRAKAPTWAKSAESAGLPPQAVPVATVKPVPVSTRVSCGRARAPETLKGAAPSVGPTPRSTTLLFPEPLITKPAMRMLPPVPTSARAERLTIFAGMAELTVTTAAALVTEEDPLVTVTV